MIWLCEVLALVCSFKDIILMKHYIYIYGIYVHIIYVDALWQNMSIYFSMLEIADTYNSLSIFSVYAVSLSLS